ncbi:MAG: hypothetical protein DI498_04335 [Paracoccus denitrificans]|nr:MAG: hypothetical protein DI498_04335 [Paracoccus denitrificans]PZO85167.1 MAG: hypothetical protein DI633_04335 [Paracoccus denitrificans]
MVWLMRFLAGPILWAVLFSAIYGLHGIGCANEWTQQSMGSFSVQRVVLVGAWLFGIALHLLLIALNRVPHDRYHLIAMANLIGLVSTVVTLFPVIITSSCMI